ncbi:MAG: hypothetical protein M3O46_06780, partial [Myxococcota bacterium]|nr:hypothetical protein [Myxococcota bacterium]
MRATRVSGGAFLVAALLVQSSARAQQTLPPLPPPTAEPPATLPPAAPPGPESPPATPTAAAPPPTQYPYAPPPTGPSGLSRAGTQAPAYSLWLGAGMGLLIYSGGLFVNAPSPPSGSSGIETTADFVRPGLAIQADVGARMAYRYIPYVTLELGIMGAGRRFEGTATTASTSFIGTGFRYLAGDANSVSFVGDISFGFRKFQVSNATGTWSASGLELFRLGFGAEIRLGPRVAVSPMLTLSGAALTDTSGNIQFALNQPDHQTHPLYQGNGPIPGAAQQSYFAIVLGCGVHF